MIAFNHALTGALIGLTIGNPVIALPVAFVSHFICDMIPHYGNQGGSEAYLSSKRFALQLVFDAIACIALVIALAIIKPEHWFVASLAAFVATSPDLAWLPGYIRVKADRAFASNDRSAFMTFAAKIQWFERPIGSFVELVWAIGAITLLVAYL